MIVFEFNLTDKNVCNLFVFIEPTRQDINSSEVVNAIMSVLVETIQYLVGKWNLFISLEKKLFMSKVNNVCILMYRVF